MALMRYLIRDLNGTYYFRRPVPEHLRPHMPGRWQGKANWKTTLGTKEPRVAKERYPGVLETCNRDFRAAEMRHVAGERDGLSEDEITALATYYRDRQLVEDDEFRLYGYRHDEHLHHLVVSDLHEGLNRSLTAAGIALARPLKAPEPPDPHRLSERQMAKLRGELEAARDDATRAFAAADTSWIGPEVDRVMDAFAVRLKPGSPMADDSRRRAGLAFLAARKQACEMRLRRLDGEVVPMAPASDDIATRKPAGDGTVVALVHSGARGRAGSCPRQRGGLTITEALALWKRLQKPSQRTEDEWSRSVNLFIELKGDMPVAAIRRSDAAEFRDALQKMPHSKHRRGALRDAPMPKLVAWAEKHPEAQRLAPGTINKNLTGLKAICEAMRADGKLDDDVEVWENPFNVRRVAGGSEHRLDYDADDLRRIFVTSPIYTEGLRPRASGGEAAFWLPLLGLFHGSREEELAQLLVEDVRCEEGVWHYLILADDGSGEGPAKRVKVAGKRLRIPLHSEVLACGFLRYWKGRRDRAGPKARLFGDLKPDSKGRHSGNWSKWWGRWCRQELGIEDKRKVFHSFRHTWKSKAREAGMDSEKSDAITGHSGGGLGRRYGSEGYSLRVLKDAIECIQFPVLDLAHLHGPADADDTPDT